MKKAGKGLWRGVKWLAKKSLSSSSTKTGCYYESNDSFTDSSGYVLYSTNGNKC